MLTPPLNRVLCGDCEEILKIFPPSCIDLIMTSPPYADCRKRVYGGVSPDQYVAWFLPKARQFYRVLKPGGTFILNIKEKVVQGERHTYVLDLIKALKAEGWLWTEEFVWHKKNSYPGKWPNRFRDAWERCLQFNKAKRFAMYQDAVRIPVSESTTKRMKVLCVNDRQWVASRSQSGFGKKMENWVGRSLVYPTNVLHLATECSNRNHSAVFPLSLPSWFINLFTKEGDVVCDPFCGSGTTMRAAQALDRLSIGIDIHADYCTLSESAFMREQPLS